MKNQFRMFLLTEEKVYLGQRVGDILTALQGLQEDAPHMGKRHLMRLIQNIVRQIRRILHGNWTFEEEKYLKVLQKVGVALMKGLDTSEDLPTLVSSCSDEVEKLSGAIQQPINNLGAPAYDEDDIDDEEDD